MSVVNELRRLIREEKLDLGYFANNDPNPYVAKMSQDSEFVDHLFLEVAASMFSQDIVIIPILPQTTTSGYCHIIRGGPFARDQQERIPGTKMPLFLGYK